MAHGLIAISVTNEKGLNNLVRHYDYDNYAIFNLSIFQTSATIYVKTIK